MPTRLCQTLCFNFMNQILLSAISSDVNAQQDCLKHFGVINGNSFSFKNFKKMLYDHRILLETPDGIIDLSALFARCANANHAYALPHRKDYINLRPIAQSGQQEQNRRQDMIELDVFSKHHPPSEKYPNDLRPTRQRVLPMEQVRNHPPMDP